MTALGRRLRRLVDQPDRGISLAEMLVAMALFAVLIALTGGFAVSAYRASAQSSTIDTATRTATVGMTDLTRTIRAATNNPVSTSNLADSAFVTATDQVLRIYAYVNLTSSEEKPVMVEFKVADGKLVETQWASYDLGKGYWGFQSTPSSVRTVASPVVGPAQGGPALFRYVDSTGATMSLAGGSVPTANVRGIAAVQVSLQVGSSTDLAKSTVLTNTVGLPNLTL
jgi:prepilin-type N-terminal cleavage/methylation domain-containing protein